MSSAQPRALVAVACAIVAYAAFLTVVVWAVAFLADVQLPRGIDHGVRHTAACTLGWLIAISSTFMTDHLEFLGARAAYRNARGTPSPTAGFCARWLYAWVRHPLMLGLMLAFWATPRMTTGHLLFATAATSYIAVGVRFEERDLERDFGTIYRDYAGRFPAYFPMRRPNRARRHEAVLAPTEKGSCPW